MILVRLGDPLPDGLAEALTAWNGFCRTCGAEASPDLLGSYSPAGSCLTCEARRQAT
jgi:hypothetical protein